MTIETSPFGLPGQGDQTAGPDDDFPLAVVGAIGEVQRQVRAARRLALLALLLAAVAVVLAATRDDSPESGNSAQWPKFGACCPFGTASVSTPLDTTVVFAAWRDVARSDVVWDGQDDLRATVGTQSRFVL